MSLLSAKPFFDSELSQHIRDFFYNDPNSIYYINPLDENNNLKEESILRQEGEAKINLFASNLGNIIYNFINQATVNPGIPVSTSGGGGATTGPGTVS